MTSKQISTSRYLIEYRNPDGSLLLPQFGGKYEATSELVFDSREYVEYPPPDLFTWANFGLLWEAMQAREDKMEFDTFMCRTWIASGYSREVTELAYTNNPLTFPETVTAYLKGLER